MKLRIPLFFLPKGVLPGQKTASKTGISCACLHLVTGSWVPWGTPSPWYNCLTTTENSMLLPYVCLQTSHSHNFKKFCKVKTFSFIQSSFVWRDLLISLSKLFSSVWEHYLVVKTFFASSLWTGSFVLWWYLLARKTWRKSQGIK